MGVSEHCSFGVAVRVIWPTGVVKGTQATCWLGNANFLPNTVGLAIGCTFSFCISATSFHICITIFKSLYFLI